MEFQVSKNGNITILSVVFSQNDGLINGEAMYVSQTPIKGIMKPTVQNGQMQFVCADSVSLGERLREPMSKVQYLLLIQQFAAIARDVKSLNLSIDKFLLDFRYIFINETTWDLQLAYLPCSAKANPNNLLGFFGAISAMAKPFREADTSYTQRFSAFLKSLDGFDYDRIENYILQEDAKVVDAVNKSHPPRNVINNVQSDNKASEKIAEPPVIETPKPVINSVNVNQVPEIGIEDLMDDDIFTNEKAPSAPIPQPVMPVPVDMDEEENTALLFEEENVPEVAPIPQPVAPIPQPVIPTPVNMDEEDDSEIFFEETVPQVAPIPQPVIPAPVNMDEEENTGLLFEEEDIPVGAPIPQPIQFDDELEDTSLLMEDAPEPEKVKDPLEDEFVYRPGVSAAVNPAPQPAPAPQPVPQPAPAPQPMVNPVPAPQPVPQPAPAPQPMVNPVPAPQPVPQPAPAPQPVVSSAPQPMTQRPMQTAVKPAYELTPAEVAQIAMGAPAPQVAPQPMMQPTPQPVVKPAPAPQVAPQPMVQPTPQPVVKPAPAPQPAPQPAPAPQVAPRPAPQPVIMPTPQPASMPVDMDEDKTSLLTDEPFAPMDTYSNNAAPAKEYIRYPSLKRIFNGDVVKITKPVFRIGKERSYVDYFVSNSNVISRSHADIIIRDNRYFITDLNSKNKTYINGRMIMPNCEMEIFDGDTITLANEDFLFKV